MMFSVFCDPSLFLNLSCCATHLYAPGILVAGKSVNFSMSSDESSDELSDANVKKLIIVTQTPPPPTKRQYDRTGDHTTRAKMNQRLNEEVEMGLRRYEYELWSNKEAEHTVSGNPYLY